MPAIDNKRSDLMPIAVVGMSCRFPGDAVNPSKLWEMLLEGRSAWSPIPKDKFNADAFFHPDPDRNGAMNVRGGHFLKEDIGLFDSSFFNISPNEAKAIDPQQRLQLESAYEALENAGIPIERVAGSDTSVYVGVFNRDYSEMLARDPEVGPAYQATGNGQAILSNRISYFFDLKGPSITIDTACSASLTALHLACQSLRTGESKMAIVGGTNMIFSPDIMVAMSLLRFLSEDGKCYTYDHRASGYSRGEGVASVVLKPLDAALRDGDPIRAVIRQSAVNQDGRTAGITLPSSSAQEALIRSAYTSAGLDPSHTTYFEAHGTGTSAGDPLEAEAISKVLGINRSPSNPVIVGSIKTNVGHLEGASGLAGLIKTILILETGLIPPNLNFEQANERIPLQQWNLKIPLKTIEWPAPGLRRASVNSFGYGGTNAHVILDDARNFLQDHYSNRAAGVTTRSTLQWESNTCVKDKLYILYSNDEASGKATAAQLSSYLVDCKEADKSLLDNLAFTLAERRSKLPWRACLRASTVDDLTASLETLRFKRTAQTPKLAFVFTGQGAQWYGMGRELLAEYPAFLERIRAADEILRNLGAQWSIYDELHKDERSSQVDLPHISQPLCTSLQIALVDLLSEWGLAPQSVTGHSSGEIAAAYTAGALSLEAAIEVAYHRGLLSSSVSALYGQEGSMLAVGLGQTEAEATITKYVKTGRAMVACVNSPTSVTVSGDSTAIQELSTALVASGIFARRLKVQTAYHSHHMSMIAEKYREAMRGVHAGNGNGIRFFSSVTGERHEVFELDADYWVQNMVSPVLFHQSVTSLCFGKQSQPSKRRPRASETPDWLIEIGPHSALSGPIRQILTSAGVSKPAYASMLVRKKNAIHTALDCVASLAADGCQVSFDTINHPRGSSAGLKVLSDLPSYSWNHGTVHWAESRYSKGYRFRQFPRHDLVGHPVSDFNLLEPRWRNFIRVAENPWVREHRVTNSILYPAAGMIVMAVEAMRQMAKLKPTKFRVLGYELRDINIGKALVVPETNEGVETMLTMRPLNTSSKESSDLWQEFRVFSHGSSEGWTEHCRGRIAYRLESAPSIVDAGREALVHDGELRLGLAAAQEACTSRVDVHDMYEALDAIRLSYGDTFRNITDMSCGPGQSLGYVQIADVARVMPYGFESDYLIHPTTLDSIIQTIFPALAPAGSVIENAIVPTFVEKIFISDSISSVAGHQYKTWSSAGFQGFKNATADINVVEAVDDELLSLVEIHGLQCSSLVESAPQDISGKAPKLCFRLDWDVDVDHLSPSSVEEMFDDLGVDPTESRTISNLEEVSFYYIQEALEELTPEDIRNLDPHHKVFHEWMRSQVDLFVAEQHPHQTSHWLNTTGEKRAEAFDIARNSCCEGQMVYRMGQNLVRILRKEVDPLELMLEDELLYDVYRNSLGNDRCYRQMVSYIQKLAYKTPTLNVLEIGAGTGGATLPIIQALADTDSRYAQFAHYDFTDISSGFFEKAQENFKAWSGLMSFKKLNIEEDPVTQGFIEGSYDLIIAANVLHATKSMKTTLENVRKLLKPSGKLVLTEITERPLRLTLVFGNLPGWWMGAEEGRRHGPSLYDHEWHDLLKETGFSGLDICRADYPQDSDHVYSVMASSAVASKRSEMPKVFVIMPSRESAVAEHTVRRLSEMCGSSIECVRTDAIPNVTGAIILCLAEVENSILTQLPEEDFSNVQRAISTSKLVLWVTTGGSVESTRAEANIVSGLARAVRAENHALKFITLDLDSRPQSDAEAAATICRIFDTATRDIDQNQGVDFEYSERSGKILISRIFEDNTTNDFIQADINPPVADLEPFSQPGRSLKLEVGVPGLLDTLRFVDDPIMERPLAPDEVDISIHATGVNFKDVMVSMGQLVEDFLGCEVAGVISAVGSSVTHVSVGDRVCSWTLGGYGNSIRNDAGFVQRIPDDMSFENAASLPLVYCTAYYSLFDVGRLAEGDAILIHAAAGGVGQAAIMLAKHVGAEVYVTVGTEEKRKLVQDQYQIPSDHIFSSRDTTFVSGVMSMTKGRGVDVILNSLAGEPLQQSWDCIARFGRFVEIGKRDIALNGKLNMSNFARNTTFSSVDLTVIIRHNKRLGARILKDVMSLVHRHAVKQVHPITVLGTTEIEVAFRLMQAGKHVGKVIIKSDMNCNVKVLPTVKHPLKLLNDASYLLVGGLGGLGRCLGLWMVSHGAKNLVFLSRSGTDRDAAKECVEELRSMGVNIAVYKCDISDLDSLKTAMAKCKAEMPPVRGLIHAGMVLRDSIFVNMTHDDWQQALRPKVQGTQNLCKVFATKDQPLDFFTILSSSVGIVGNFGQSNYAAGGTFQDAIARYNSSNNGLPITTLDLGMILSVGFVAENEYAATNLKKWGFLGITQEQFLAMVKSTILRPRRSASESQVLTGLGTRGMVDDGMNAHPDEDYEIPFWFYDVKFSHLLQLDRGYVGAESTGEDVNLSVLLRTADSMSTASQLCVEALLVKMSKVLMLPLEDLNPASPMAAYGVDSLVAVELRNWIFREMKVDLPVFELLGNNSLSEICEIVARRSSLVSDELKS